MWVPNCKPPSLKGSYNLMDVVERSNDGSYATVYHGSASHVWPYVFDVRESVGVLCNFMYVQNSK